MSVQTPALQFEHLSKRFGGTRALVDVDLTIMPGEIHGLLGENGSGKSTLIKILAGYHKPEAGSLNLYGRQVSLPLAAGSFRDDGLAFVHQDLALIPELAVVDNLWVDRLAQPESRLRISWARARREARAAFARYGVEIDPTAAVGDLQPVDRALLAIVRAAEGLRASADQAGHPGLLVLDEPTVFLPATGTRQLFALVRRIAESGASVLFVSHDLSEVLELTDRLTVLRDGRRVATVKTSETTESGLVELIIGRQLTAREMVGAPPRTGHPVQASVANLCTDRLNQPSLALHRGEVLGVTGLAGSGYDDLLYALFGARPASSGELTLEGRTHDLRRMTPLKAIEAGMGLIPADRQRAGSIGTLTLEENLTIRMLADHSTRFYLPRGRIRRQARMLLAEYDVRPDNPQLSYAALSGGNQQKVLMAKWLLAKPSVLLLDEPTQGVDVGAREQIFELIRAVAADGASIICATCDYESLAVLCSRVLVFGRGRMVDELVGQEITKDKVAERCYASLGRGDEGTLQDAVSW